MFEVIDHNPSMSLESFFTPIELENGLVSPSKVEKLVALIQQDSIQNGKCEMLSHRYTIAKVLSVTECGDSLRNFVRFGGLKELDRWLHEAQIEVSDNEKPAEDLTIKVLDALKKLPLDEEGIEGCGIRKTVAGFLSHKNIEIQSRSETLSAYWVKKNNTDDDSLKETSKVHNLQACENVFVKKSCDNYLKLDCQETVTFTAKGIPTESFVKEIHSGPRVQDTLSTCGRVDLEMVFSDQKDISSEKLLQHKIVGDAADCLTSSMDVAQKTDGIDAPLATISAQQNHTRTSESKENIINLGNDRIPKGDRAVMHLDDSSDTEKTQFEVGPMPLPSKAIENKQATLSYTPRSANHPSPLLVPGDSNSNCKESIILTVKRSPKKRHADSPSAIMGEDSPDYWKKIMQQENPAKNNDVSTSKTTENRETLHCFDDVGTASNKINLLSAEGVKHDFGVQASTGMMTYVAKEKHDSTLPIEKDSSIEMDGKKLEMDLACGVLDALEVARQVAREVEEEVGIYREGSCSSGSKPNLDGEATHLGIADSASTQNLSEAERNDSCTEQNNLVTSHSSKEDQETSSDKEELLSEVEDTQDNDPSMPENKDVFRDQGSSQLTNLTQITFDLNEDIQMDDTDCLQLSPGAIASPSNGTKTSSPPVPVAAVFEEPVGSSAKGLLFGVDLRQGGAGTMSMLCSTSSQRASEKDNSYSNEDNSFDLNVADGGATKIGVHADKHGKRGFPVSSYLPSDDLSVETCSKKRTEIIDLDLNRIDKNCQALSSDRLACYGLQNKSSVSSASAGYFDLNDNPSFRETFNSNGLDLDRPRKIARLNLAFPSTDDRKTRQESVRAFTLDGFYPGYQEPATIQQKELGVFYNPFLGDGSGVPSFFGQIETKGTLQPRSLAYATPPAFVHDGLSLGLTIPSGSSGPQGNEGVPFMSDLRGPMLGLGMPVQQPPWIMGPTQQRTNGMDTLRPSIDLNAVVTPAESGESSGIRNLFFPGRSGSSSCFSFEPYQFDYKRTTWN